MQKAVRWPCSVCGIDIGSNSIQYTSWQKWIHKKCSSLKGSMFKVMKSFICRGCLNPLISTGCAIGGMLTWSCVWVKVQICIWPSYWHCYSLSLAPVNSDWFYLSVAGSPGQSQTKSKRAVKRLCVCACVCAYVHVAKCRYWCQFKSGVSG